MFKYIFIFFLTIFSCSKFNNNNFINKNKFVEGMELDQNVYLEIYIDYSELTNSLTPTIYLVKTAKTSGGKKNILSLDTINVEAKKVIKKDNPSLIETDSVNKIFELSFDKLIGGERINKSVSFVELSINFKQSVETIEQEITAKLKQLQKNRTYLEEYCNKTNQQYILDVLCSKQIIEYILKNNYSPILENTFSQCVDKNKVVTLPNEIKVAVFKDIKQKIDATDQEKIFWIVFFTFNEYGELEILDVALKNGKKDIAKVLDKVELEIEKNNIYLIHTNISKKIEKEVVALNINEYIDFDLRYSKVMEYIFDTNESIKDQIGTNSYIEIGENRYAFVAKNIYLNIKNKITWKKNKDGSFTKSTSDIGHVSNDIGEAEPYVATFKLDSRGKIVILDMASLIRNREDEAIFLDEDTDIKLNFKNNKLIVEYRTNILESKKDLNGNISFQIYLVSSNNSSDKRSIDSLCKKRYILELLNDIMDKYSAFISISQHKYGVKVNLFNNKHKYVKKIRDIVERYENIDSSYDKLLQIINDIENDNCDFNNVIEGDKIKDIDSIFLSNGKKESEKDLEELIRFKIACDEVRRYRKNKNVISIYDNDKMSKAFRTSLSLIYSKAKGMLKMPSTSILNGEEIHNEQRCPLCSDNYSFTKLIKYMYNSMFSIDKCHNTNKCISEQKEYKYNFTNTNLSKDKKIEYGKVLSNSQIKGHFGIADMDICYESATFIIDEKGNLRTSTTSRKKEDEKRMTREVGGNIFDPRIVLSGNVVRRVIPLPD